jgi:S-methylmethionine-dependent homocysteine/selenocysteine methylase
MSFVSCYETNPVILMEGALGERLKREYDLQPNDAVAFADIIYRKGGKEALLELWKQYIDIAKINRLPFIATTPTRRANIERVAKGGYEKNITSGHFI